MAEEEGSYNKLLLLCEALPKDEAQTSSKSSASDQTNPSTSAPSTDSMDETMFTPLKHTPERPMDRHSSAKVDRKGKKKIRRTSAKECKRSPNLDQLRRSSIASLPASMFAAFNSGDMDMLSDVIDCFTSENVQLSTNALPSPLTGRPHLLALFQALIDGHPDSYMLSPDPPVITDCSIITRLTFKGTKALPCPNEFYFFKPSLVDNMDLSRRAEAEIVHLRQMETDLVARNRPIDVEFNGFMILHYANRMVTRLAFDCVLDRFSEAAEIPIS